MVESRAVELTRGASHPDSLTQIAVQTKAQHFQLSDHFWEDLKVTDPDVVEVDKRRNIDLWDNA